MKSNWKQILSVVLFSTMLWALVTLSDSFFTNIYFPVKVNINNKDYTIKSKSDEYVIVGVEAEGWLLSSYYWGKKNSFVVNLEDNKKQQIISTREVLKKNNLISSSINIISLSPQILTIDIEKKYTKKVVVQPRFSITFEKDYGFVSPITTEPNEIIISGPESTLDKIDTIWTYPVKIEKISSSYSDNILLEIPREVVTSAKSVNVQFEVQKIVDRVVDLIPINIVGERTNRELEVFPSFVSILIRGGIDIVGAAKAEEFKVEINYRDAINDTTGFLIPKISTDKNYKIINIIPDKIEYIIKK